MPLLRHNCGDDPAEVCKALVGGDTSGTPDAPVSAGDPDAPVTSESPDAPVRRPRRVIVMIHGYKFMPNDPVHCPHLNILSLTPCRRSRATPSWPRHLGSERLDAAAPLCIAFGWNARGSIWRAWMNAAVAARDLARLIDRIAQEGGAPVHMIAHSLGARVALCGMAMAAPGGVGRIVLLSGAVLRGEAARCLTRGAGQQAEVVNVTSRENNLFDGLLEMALGYRGRAIGRGLRRPHPRWLDLRIDDDATRAGLVALGHRIAAPPGRVCHWSGYLRPGLFGFYRRLLDHPEVLALDEVRANLPAASTARRWRLAPRRPLDPTRRLEP